VVLAICLSLLVNAALLIGFVGFQAAALRALRGDPGAASVARGRVAPQPLLAR
jgi:uncharacterized protein YciW